MTEEKIQQKNQLQKIKIYQKKKIKNQKFNKLQIKINLFKFCYFQIYLNSI